MLNSIFVYAEGIDLICSPNQTPCLNCPEYETIFPVVEFTKNTSGIEVEAKESEIIDGKYLLSGNVEINSKNIYLLGDNVEVSSIDDSINATGKVKFQDSSYLIISDSLSANKKDEEFSARASNALYQDYSEGQLGANGYTEFIEKTPSTVLLTNSTYSICPLNNNDWFIKADKIKLDLDENRGVADNAVLKFYGIPIFYTPKYSWVLSGRGSGFLTPDYFTYNEPTQKNDSYGYRVPYYINLAPDRDLLTALNYMSSRGFIYEAKYRQLIPRFEIEAKLLPNDKITNLSRWLINFSEELELSEKTHLTANFYRVSDAKYFQEIERSNTDIESLKSNLSLNYNDLDKDFSIALLTENEQIVNAGAAKYNRSLEGSISKKFTEIKNTEILVSLVSTNFTHDNTIKESGTRTHGDISATRRLNWNYPKITPNISTTITNYSLKNSPNINRIIFGSGIDFDFTINNRSSMFGYEANHRITPLVTYKYRAKKVQGNIPLFDSTDKYDDIISFADLTSGERYTGLDRITNANDFTLSLESAHRKIGAFEEENDLLNFKIAQSFYTDDEVVSDSTNTNYEIRKSYSDIAASVDLAVNKFSFRSALQYDPSKTEIVKKENTFSYKPSSRKFVSISLIDEGTKETEKILGAYPISKFIHVFGGIDKTTSSGITKTETLGIAYESCCWAFRLAHFKEKNPTGRNDHSTGMEIVLSGLGSTASSLKGKIENKIPGYSADLR
jgi:LPS-assembly protein